MLPEGFSKATGTVATEVRQNQRTSRMCTTACVERRKDSQNGLVKNGLVKNDAQDLLKLEAHAFAHSKNKGMILYVLTTFINLMILVRYNLENSQTNLQNLGYNGEGWKPPAISKR